MIELALGGLLQQGYQSSYLLNILLCPRSLAVAYLQVDTAGSRHSRYTLVDILVHTGTHWWTYWYTQVHTGGHTGTHRYTLVDILIHTGTHWWTQLAADIAGTHGAAIDRTEEQRMLGVPVGHLKLLFR